MGRPDLTPRGIREPRLPAHPALVALCVGAAVLEAGLVGLLGPRAALALTPQGLAPAPFGVFHDLRWLLVYAQSWPTLAMETVAFVLVRGGLTALTVRLAWPHDRERPPISTLMRRAVTFTLAAAVLLTFSSSLLVGLAVASISYLFFAAVPVALLVALLIHHGPVVDWWRTGPTLRTLGWTALTFAVLTAAGGVMAVSPWPAHLAVAAVAGLFNAWAWLGMVRALAHRRSRRIVPLAPVGVVTVIAIVIFGVSVATEMQTAQRSIADANARAVAQTAIAAQADPHGQPVLILTGYWSHWHGDGDWLDLGPGFVQRRFSYAGLGPDKQPRIFHGPDTDQELPRLITLLDEQVQAFADATGRRLDLVSDSEGSLVAKAYLLVHPEAPVRTLVLTSPLVAPGRAYYPAPHTSGYGIAAGWELRALGAALRALTPLAFSPDGPFLRSVANHAPALRGSLECPLAGTDQLAMFPLADAVGAPYDETSDVPAVVLPAFHGKLLHERDAQRTIGEYLRTGHVPGYHALRLTERLVRAAAAAWQAPSLRMSLNDVWHPLPDGASCTATTARLREWLR